MNIIGAIFARGKSKGIKDKNLLPFKRTTLVGHAILQGYSAKYIKKIYVSSDSKKIIKEAKKYQAIVPFIRPKSLSSDRASHISVWRHFVSYLKKKNIKVDYIVDIPTTSPLRRISDIEKCIKLALRNKLDMVFTITKSSKNPYFNMLELKRKKFQLIKTSKIKIIRRQDAPKCFDLTTVCYVFKPNYVLKNNSLLKGKVGFIEIPRERGIDIDDKFDYKLVKLIAGSEKN